MVAVYNYSDFGTQALAADLLGPEWWQWNNHGDSDPATTYDIKVAIYAHGGRKAAMTKYIVNPATESDYRYVSYGKAVDFLETTTAYLDSMTIEEDGVTFPKTSTQLKATQKKILTDVCDNS